jgi:hypothetical protein
VAIFAPNLEQEENFEGVVSDLGFCLTGDRHQGVMVATVSGGAAVHFIQGSPETLPGT